MQIPVEIGHLFRLKPDTQSGSFRTPSPVLFGQAIRSDFGHFEAATGLLSEMCRIDPVKQCEATLDNRIGGGYVPPMARERLSMREIKEVLRLKYELNLSLRDIARASGVPRSTVADYLSRADKAELSWPLPAGLDQQGLWEKLFEEASPGDRATPPAPKDVGRALPDWACIHKELRRKHVTLQLLWQEYRQGHPEGYGRSQFCHLYKQWANRLDPVQRHHHEPGEKLFVDWGGAKLEIRDPVSGKSLHACLFVAAMGASHKIYVEAFADQKLSSWITAHVHALSFYSGVPRLIVPDNTKTGVAAYCRYEPKIHPTYQEMAEHYGTAILPTRARKPRDKASVETAVQIAQRMILGALRDYTFFSLGAANEQIRRSLAQINAKPFSQKEGCRDELFEKIDKAALGPLPRQPYELAQWRKAKVNIDYHIVVDKHFYSVPYHYVHRRVEVRLSASTLEVYHNGKRIAVHLRSDRAGAFSTILEHRPKSHQRHAQWTPRRLIGWARKVGPCCALLAEQILQTRPHPEQGYRSCLGLMHLARDVGEQRMEAACRRAVDLQAYSYRSVKSILQTKLDQLHDQAQLPLSPPHHENLRGAGYYEQSLDPS